ncbi:MAG: MFS transporter [Rubellimicrobium sp.]|nr:MFS transporter [Rubellimicrobium sp.]
MISERRRIWGWMFFDWAQQPYFTLGLTFVFGPYFAAVASGHFMQGGMAPDLADARAQSLWTLGQTVTGLVIAVTAPFIGAWADASGRKIPWIAAFGAIYILAAWSMWFLLPDGTGLYLVLVLFSVGFFAAEGGINVSNAILPSLGDERTVGRISGSGAAFGYWGGVVALALMLLLLAENSAGVTLLGQAPAFGLDPALREGTRAVGPFTAIWCAVFMIPFFLWVREPAARADVPPTIGRVVHELWATIASLRQRRSLGAFLVSSMLYRDALNGIYAIGGVYAALVLGWSIIQIGIFGIVGAITAAVVTWIGGLHDAKFGPKPVIVASVWALIVVSAVVVGMSRDQIFGLPLAEGSVIPDLVFYLCGAAIGGAGGSVYAASRTMMIRHADPARPAEAFGLFALTGKATAFLAPALVTLATAATGSVRLGVAPVIVLFLLGLLLLRFVDRDGERPA